MALSTQPYKGARDFYPEDKRVQDYMFSVLRATVKKYGYEEYDAPILEPLDLFRAKTGEEIVNEQVYSFVDRGGREVAIRPEMTPTVSRMVAGRRQELSYPLRWFSIPNLWRYERPQRGRLREHWQLNVDIFGEAGFVGVGETRGNIYRVYPGTQSPDSQQEQFSAGLGPAPWYPQGYDVVWECKGISGSGKYHFDYFFGDGGQQLNVRTNVYHKYGAAGTYTARCVVHDEVTGETASVSTQIALPQYPNNRTV